MTGRASERRPAPGEPTYAADDDGLRWYTVEEVSKLCLRSPSTIKGLISKHGLPRKLAWRTIRRRRQRLQVVSPSIAKWLQRATLFRQADLERPPR